MDTKTIKTTTSEDSKVSKKIYHYYAQNENDTKLIDEVIQKYPIKFTPFLLKLFKHSDAIKKQFLPSMKK